MDKDDKIFLYRYYLREIDDMHSFMEVIPGHYRFKDLHSLRVRIKRIKSIYRLLEYAYPEEFRAKTYNRLFKAVFKSAGLIRESQINLRLLRGYPYAESLRKAYYRYLVRLRPGWKEDLDKSINYFDYASLDEHKTKVEELISRTTVTGLIDIIDRFIRSEAGKVRNMLDRQDDLKYFHEVRIVLKNIKPLLALIWRRKDNSYTRDDYDHLNDTEKFIGQWHDRAVLCRSLREGLDSGLLPERISEEFINLENEVRQSDNETFENIRANLSLLLEMLGQGD